VPLAPKRELLERLRAGLPELPARRQRRLEQQHGLDFRSAAALIATPGLADRFEEVAALSGDSRAAANIVLNDFSAHLNEARITPAESPVGARAMADLVALVADGTLGSAGVKQVFAALVAGEGGGDARRIVEERGLAQISDTGAIRDVVVRVVSANPAQAEQYRGGKEALLGYFVGQVMRETGGRAEPRVVQELLRETLAG
jgi:aspartyl-tRNA(Asn)/glutamyl-tRNA(Gln) amidotransferase subunit B